MEKESYQNVTLGSSLLFKARILLGGLLLITIILASFGLYNGIISGDFKKVFWKPIEQLIRDMENAQNETETHMQLPSSPTMEPTVTVLPTETPVKKIYRQAISCIRMNIREGEFASNKCYSQSDYDDLQYYLNRFNSEVFEYDGAIASMKITCNGSEFFKQSCEDDQKRKADSEAGMNNYRGIIQAIIARGR